MESFEEMKQRYQQEMMRYAKRAGQAAPDAAPRPAAPASGLSEPPQMSGPSAPDRVSPEQVSPEQVSPEQSSPEQSLTEQVSPEQVSPEQSLTGPAALEPASEQPIPQTPPTVPPAQGVTRPSEGETGDCTHHSPASDREERDTSYGTLTVRVSTAREALPIPEALVLVSREIGGRPTLQWAGQTDISGNTPEIRLPAPDASLSESPGNPHPYASYRIQVDKNGFYTAEFRGVPIFAGVTSVQPAELIPYPERESSVKERVVVEREPSDL